MLNSRGWWFVMVVAALMAVAVFREQTFLTVLFLTLILWFGWEWLWFAIRARIVVRGLMIRRELGDERGPVESLWAARSFRVRTELHLESPLKLPYVWAGERVPFE